MQKPKIPAFVLAENVNISELLPKVPNGGSSAAGQQQLERQPKQQQLDQLIDLQQLLSEQLGKEATPSQPWDIREGCS